MSLFDELKADQDPRLGQCKVCVWLRSLPAAQQREWAEAFADRAYTTSSLIRAVLRRNPNLGRTVIESHRRKAHVL